MDWGVPDDFVKILTCSFHDYCWSGSWKRLSLIKRCPSINFCSTFTLLWFGSSLLLLYQYFWSWLSPVMRIIFLTTFPPHLPCTTCMFYVVSELVYPGQFPSGQQVMHICCCSAVMATTGIISHDINIFQTLTPTPQINHSSALTDHSNTIIQK